MFHQCRTKLPCHSLGHLWKYPQICLHIWNSTLHDHFSASCGKNPRICLHLGRNRYPFHQFHFLWTNPCRHAHQQNSIHLFPLSTHFDILQYIFLHWHDCNGHNREIGNFEYPLHKCLHFHIQAWSFHFPLNLACQCLREFICLSLADSFLEIPILGLDLGRANFETFSWWKLAAYFYTWECFEALCQDFHWFLWSVCNCSQTLFLTCLNFVCFYLQQSYWFFDSTICHFSQNEIDWLGIPSTKHRFFLFVFWCQNLFPVWRWVHEFRGQYHSEIFPSGSWRALSSLGRMHWHWLGGPDCGRQLNTFWEWGKHWWTEANLLEPWRRYKPQLFQCEYPSPFSI